MKVPARNLLVIIVAGSLESSELINVFDHGSNDYISMPVDFPQLSRRSTSTPARLAYFFTRPGALMKANTNGRGSRPQGGLATVPMMVQLLVPVWPGAHAGAVTCRMGIGVNFPVDGVADAARPETILTSGGSPDTRISVPQNGTDRRRRRITFVAGVTPAFRVRRALSEAGLAPSAAAPSRPWHAGAQTTVMPVVTGAQCLKSE